MEYKANNHLLVSGDGKLSLPRRSECISYLSSASLRKVSYIQIASEVIVCPITFTNGSYLYRFTDSAFYLVMFSLRYSFFFIYSRLILCLFFNLAQIISLFSFLFIHSNLFPVYLICYISVIFIPLITYLFIHLFIYSSIYILFLYSLIQLFIHYHLSIYLSACTFIIVWL